MNEIFIIIGLTILLIICVFLMGKKWGFHKGRISAFEETKEDIDNLIVKLRKNYDKYNEKKI